MKWLRNRFDVFANRLITRALSRTPDFIIGGHDRPYLLRWYLLGGKWKTAPGEKPRWVSRSILGVVRPYLHCFLRSDDDRAHHDHPAASISRALRGEGTEHTIAAGGVNHRRVIRAGDWRYRSATFTHRIEIEPGAVFWTLFIFFRDVREWGFHCPSGWVHWKVFTAADDPGSIGAGCGEA